VYIEVKQTISNIIEKRISQTILEVKPFDTGVGKIPESILQVAGDLLVKYGDGQIGRLPGGANGLYLRRNVDLQEQYEWAKVVSGGAGESLPTWTAVVAPTTVYAQLVAPPAAGARLVSAITLVNESTTVTADFFIQLVKSATAYLPFAFSLAPGEKLILQFPFFLDASTEIQTKVSATVTGHVIASYADGSGISVLSNFTGNTWTNIFTTAASKVNALTGIMVMNTATTTQKMGLQVVNDALATQFVTERNVSPGAAWFLDLKMTLPAGWSLQVRHGSASLTGSAAASYVEV